MNYCLLLLENIYLQKLIISYLRKYPHVNQSLLKRLGTLNLITEHVKIEFTKLSKLAYNFFQLLRTYRNNIYAYRLNQVSVDKWYGGSQTQRALSVYVRLSKRLFQTIFVLNNCVMMLFFVTYLDFIDYLIVYIL